MENQDKFKVIVKRSDLNDLQRRVNSGEICKITYQDKEYVLDTNKTEHGYEVRLYPPDFTFKGRSDGYYLVVALHEGWERHLLESYSEILQQLPGSFDNYIIEVNEDVPAI